MLARRGGVSVREQLKESPGRSPRSSCPINGGRSTADRSRDAAAARSVGAVMDEVTPGALTRIRAAAEKPFV